MLGRIRLWLLRRKGLNALSDNNWSRAIEAFESLNHLNPEDRGAVHNLALAYMGAERFEDAEQCFLENLKRLGEYYPRLRALADLYYLWGKREQAQRYYRKALDEAGDEAKALIEERIRLTADDKTFSAVQQADRAYRAGVKALQEEIYSEAAEHFREAARKDPSHVLAWNNLGTVLMNHYQDYDGAARVFETARQYEQLPILQANLEKLAEAKSMADRRKARRRSKE
jgi:Flp pilus assembly protein TadD